MLYNGEGMRLGMRQAYATNHRALRLNPAH